MIEKELPQSWQLTNLEDITDYIQRGKSPKYIEKSDYPIVNQKAVRWNGLVEEYLKYVDPEQWNQWAEERKLKIGDILWNSTGTGTIGRACFINKDEINKAKVVDSHVTIVRPNSNIESKYAFYWIKSPNVQDNILNLFTGTTNQVELPQSVIKSLAIPLPPFAEQKRIVAKLDEAFQHLDILKAKLARIPELLKTFRQSVLSQAVTGNLTEEWREENKVEPTKELYSRIRKRIKSTSKRTVILNSDSDEAPFIIPAEWLFINLGELCEKLTYGTSSKSDNEGEVPVLRMGNLQKGKIDFTDLKYTSDPEEIVKYALKKGDILFNRTNSPELVGKTSIYECDDPAIYAGYLIKIWNYSELNSYYLNHVLNSVYAKGWALEVKSDGVSQSNINAQKLSDFLIPLPSEEEQMEIIKRVEALFSKANALERYYATFKEKVDKLPQSILAKAFRGELVPQDKNDEPATILLEKIIASKENQIQNKKKLSPNKSSGNAPVQMKKKQKPTKSFNEFVERLQSMGGEATPEQLLVESSLEEDVDLFFEFLRDGRNTGKLNVPTGEFGTIEIKVDAH